MKLANATGLYMEGIRDGNVRAAVETYTGDRYTQHSTGVADGVKGFVASFEPFVASNPDRDIRIVRSIVDGDYVFVHAYQDINHGEARWVTTDLFETDDDDKIVGHWDVIAAFLEGSADGHTQIDGATETVDEDRTEQNKALVASFIDDVLVNRRVDRIGTYVSADTFIQHSHLVSDGIEALNEFMVGPGGTDMACFDIFRVDNGLLVEHWDNAEPLPQGPQPNSGEF